MYTDRCFAIHDCFICAPISYLFNFLKIVKGVETTDPSYFITPQNIERLKQAKEANSVQVCFLSLLGDSPTLANLVNDHGFISKEYISIGMRPFGEAQSKPLELILKLDNIIPLW